MGTITAGYRLTYRTAEPITESIWREFGHRNVRANAWPYARELRDDGAHRHQRTWWRGDVGPSRIVFRAMPDSATRAEQLESDAIGVAYSLARVDALRLRDTADITMAEIESIAASYIGFNAQKAPFDDVRVRQAINHAVDVDAIIDEVY